MTEAELSYILAIAGFKNITQAANILYISQPSLSQALSKIEQGYGQSIFYRTAAGLLPTAFGQRYIETAQRILREYRCFENQLAELCELSRGELRFGLPQYLGTIILPSILPSFVREYPGIQIQYYENTSGELHRMMREGKIDFALMHYYGDRHRADTHLLLTDPFYLAAPAKDSPPQGPPYPTARMEDFASENFILISPGHKSREIQEIILKKAGIHPPIRYTTKNMETAKRLAAAGLGVTLLPQTSLRSFSGSNALQLYRLPPKAETAWKLIISQPEGQRLSCASREFIRLLKDYFSSL